MARQKTGKVKQTFKGLRFFLVSFLLVCVMGASICGVALALYLRMYIEPNATIDVNELVLDMDMTSIVYAWDKNKEDFTEYEVLRGLENRIWANLDQIPKDLQQAFIAIEDKRFYEHKGVDWKRTGKAVFNWVGGHEGGGSTITQQLIKNLTKFDDYSIKRKLTEIFRALQMEKDLNDKDRILEMYLNLIYLGQGAYGVNTAATTYFGKNLSDLDLAECAIIAGITKNPSLYDPFNYPNRIKERQETILDQMYEQGMISKSERDDAKAEQLEYKYEAAKEALNNTYSYFTDTVINDVIRDLVEKKNYPEELAKWKVTSGGVQIYTTVDLDVQKAMDEVYEDDSNFPNISRNGMRPESAMVICNAEGDVVGIVGGRGKKSANRVLVRSDSSRQSGSSIKPLSIYGPSMDRGLITPYSIELNEPFKEINGKPWPRNDSGGYSGPMVMRTAIARSINAVAVRVVDKLTPQVAFDFLTQQLNFTHLNSSDIDYSPMALGGMNGGVTVREMASGFTIFLNDGVYNGARTYSKVINSDGTVLLDNEPLNRQVFENQKTVYYMREVLGAVTEAGGTASRINISGMDTAGKTGTSQKKRDLWFAGFTPYYVGATWFGYDSNYDLTGIRQNPSVTIWNKVMNKIHEDLPSKRFDKGDDSNFETASYCTITGLSPSAACIANGTVATGRYWKGDAPTKVDTTCKYHAPEPDPGETDPENPDAPENPTDGTNTGEPGTNTGGETGGTNQPQLPVITLPGTDPEGQ